MRTISPLDLRRSLGQILDQASAGERFVIARDHRPLAMLVSVEDGQRLDEDQQERIKRRLAALDRLVAFGEESRQKYPSDLSAVDAVRLDRDRDEPGAENV
ncbi:MAG TPA: type II toxin-antitoxin system Phd/YefM family antitoxin [Candidatus Saccharimonadales bacterium]|nr:type II toxin-antitoxin system Phd/YefM family antitoxin [Candidatus Saccharimonadales bacterium]